MNAGPFWDSAPELCPIEVLGLRSAKPTLQNPLIELNQGASLSSGCFPQGLQATLTICLYINGCITGITVAGRADNCSCKNFYHYTKSTWLSLLWCVEKIYHQLGQLILANELLINHIVHKLFICYTKYIRVICTFFFEALLPHIDSIPPVYL